jgi:hypothetical protein
MSKFIDLTGQRFGRLIVLEKFGKNKYGKVTYRCQCDCGNTCITMGEKLKRNTKSCGCLQRDNAKFAQYKNDRKEVYTKKIYTAYIKGAIKRGYTFELSLEEFRELIFNKCFYCGIESSNNYKYLARNIEERIVYNGIDRVDNSLGYIENNVVTCCKKCNETKRAMSQKDFLSWIEKVYDYSIKNKKEFTMDKAREFAIQTVEEFRKDIEYNEKWLSATEEEKEFVYEYYINFFNNAEREVFEYAKKKIEILNKT